jgi:hypothetical protein
MKLELKTLQSLFSKSKLDAKKENLIAPCPKCSKMEFGIAINKENQPCQCYRKKHCGWSGNIYSLLAELGRTDLISNTRDYTDVMSGRSLTNSLEETEENLTQTSFLPITAPIGWRRIFDHPYLKSRNFTEYQRYEVGTTRLDPKLKNDYIIFLIRQEGQMRGYIGRNVMEKKQIEENNQVFKETGKGRFIARYLNSENTDFSSLLFGYDEITSNTATVILVEGIFDKFRVDKLLDLHSSDLIKCVCSFKCHLSEEQKFLLKRKGIENLILLYDSDVVKDIQKTVNSIMYEFDIKIGFHPNPSIDPGDYNFDDIELVLTTLQPPFSFLTSVLSENRLE